MSMQNGSKRSSPSIIARLMGLDGLPPHKEPNPVDNQQRRPIPSEKARGKQTYGDHVSLRRGSMDEQRFKDVFEVLEVEKEKSSTSLYQRKVNANLTEAEMMFIRHKFMEAKRLSTDEKLRYSKEFNETLEALDSNNDLLLKFLHQPDSLFAKNLPHLQSIAPKSQSSGPNHFKTLKVDRDLLGKSHRSTQWNGGGASPSHSNTTCAPYADTVDLSKRQQKKRSGLKPTEIVVLKPNLGKPQTTGRTLPSQSSFCEVPCTSSREPKAFGNLKANEDVSLLRNKSRDSRAIASIVSRQMKARFGNESSMNFEISRFRGYARDESSSGSDSSSESKLMSVISRARTDLSRNHCLLLSSLSSESSVSKETMRRLSERWKLANSYEKEIEIRRRNTLAEMLATSDREARQEGLSKRCESNVGQSELPEPIGISSRDGWKGTGKRNLSKSRTIMHEDRTCVHTIVLPKMLTTRDGLVKRSSFHHRELFFSNNSHFSDNINRPSSSKSLHLDGGLTEDNLPALKTQNSLSVHADSDSENGSDYEDAKSTSSLEPLDLSAVTSFTDHDISGRPTEEFNHSSIPQLQSQESAEEGDQPSPVSIPQTSFHDECFESLSADLQGLRMQLQLLKRESATYNEGDMLVSSDEEDADQEESSIVTDETMIIHELGEDWKSLYIADVLANSRFSDLNPRSFMASWHSSEVPVDPSLFEDLEKYSSLKTSTRLERKFLFDRINSEILEFFEQFTDHKPTKVCPKWDISMIHETLQELVTRRSMIQSRDTKEKQLQWPNLEDGIEMIGKEIEDMLTDEVIAELVT